MSASYARHERERGDIDAIRRNARMEAPLSRRMPWRRRAELRLAAREDAWLAIHSVRGSMLSAATHVRWFSRCEDAAQVDRAIASAIERLGEARAALADLESALRAFRDTWK